MLQQVLLTLLFLLVGGIASAGIMALCGQAEKRKWVKPVAVLCIVVYVWSVGAGLFALVALATQ